MKRILLKAYLCDNLGDDLFVYILTKRYTNMFYTYEFHKNKYLKKIPNLKYKKNFLDYFVDKFSSKMFKCYDYSETRNKSQYDLLIYIGGSLFIEDNNMDFWKKSILNYNKNYIPYFIIGSNVGPWTNHDFVKLLEDNVFKNAEDVCFRDCFSCQLYNQLSNVRYSRDIVFGITKYFQFNNRVKKHVLFSIIDVSNKKINPQSYEKKMTDLIYYFLNNGYTITLMSFCRREGDEKAINRIYKSFKKNKNVDKYYYRGDIESALQLIDSAEIIVASRFHAAILGLTLNKYVIPISYSKKLNNVLNDLNFKGKVFDIYHMDALDENDIMDNIHDYCLGCIDNIDIDEPFIKLDKLLNRSE